MLNTELSLKEILLTWRDDKFYGPAWHIPGGVVRYGETLENRVHLVACVLDYNFN